MKRRKFKDVRKSKLKHQIVDGNGSKKDSNLIHDTGKCSCGLENVFPEYLPWYLFVLIVCVRIYYVLQPRNWWLLHPDEIFQSVEGNIMSLLLSYCLPSVITRIHPRILSWSVMLIFFSVFVLLVVVPCESYPMLPVPLGCPNQIVSSFFFSKVCLFRQF